VGSSAGTWEDRWRSDLLVVLPVGVGGRDGAGLGVAVDGGVGKGDLAAAEPSLVSKVSNALQKKPIKHTIENGITDFLSRHKELPAEVPQRHI